MTTPAPPPGFELIPGAPPPPPGFELLAAPDQRQGFGIDFTAKPAEVRAAIERLPEAERKAARKAWADSFVSAERKGNSGASQSIMDRVRQFTAAPIRPWLDEISGGLGQALHSVSGGSIGAPYDEAKALSQARKDAEDANATKLFRAPVIGDVTTGTVAQFAGGLAAAPVMPGITALRGTTMLPRMVNSAATGVAYGGLLGGGEGEDMGDRALNATFGAGVGGLLGGAIPPLARGLGNATSFMADKVRPRPAILEQFSRPAVERLSRAAEADGLSHTGLATQMPAARANLRAASGAANGSGMVDPLTEHRIMARAPYLGTDQMLLDAGPNMRARAGAVASMPGEGAQTIRTALEGRRMATPTRITTDVDATLGPAIADDLVAREGARIANQMAKPHYDAFYAQPVKVTENLYGLLDRAKAVGAIERAQKLMAADGFDPKDVFYKGYPNSGQNNAALNARFIDYIKRGVDDVARSAPRGSNEERISSGIARGLRDEVDNILSPGKPEASPWAIARKLSGDGKDMREAIELGNTLFGKGATAREIKAEMQGMAPMEAQMLQAGARNQIRRTMTQSATQWGDNGDTAVRRLLASIDSRDKLRLVIGDASKADRLVNRIDAETAFAKSEQEILANSKTAERLASQKDFPSPTDRGETASRLGNKSATGLALEMGYRLANALTGGALNERRMNVAAEAAKMLTARGYDAQAIINGLLDYRRGAALSGARRDQIDRLVVRLLEASRQPAVAGVTD